MNAHPFVAALQIQQQPQQQQEKQQQQTNNKDCHKNDNINTNNNNSDDKLVKKQMSNRLKKYSSFHSSRRSCLLRNRHERSLFGSLLLLFLVVVVVLFHDITNVIVVVVAVTPLEENRPTSFFDCESITSCQKCISFNNNNNNNNQSCGWCLQESKCMNIRALSLQQQQQHEEEDDEQQQLNTTTRANHHNPTNIFQLRSSNNHHHNQDSSLVLVCKHPSDLQQYQCPNDDNYNDNVGDQKSINGATTTTTTTTRITQQQQQQQQHSMTQDHMSNNKQRDGTTLLMESTVTSSLHENDPLSLSFSSSSNNNNNNIFNIIITNDNEKTYLQHDEDAYNDNSKTNDNLLLLLDGDDNDNDNDNNDNGSGGSDGDGDGGNSNNPNETPIIDNDENNNNNNDPALNSFYSSFFNDPRYSDEEWSYDMIHVQQAWERGYTGNSIRVRINDNGVLTSHVEFASRFDWSASCSTRVEPSAPEESHGTFVAGIVAGGGNNNQCAVGIAPQALLSACYALSASERFLGENIEQMDISQNSYERPACNRRRRRRRRHRRTRENEEDYRNYYYYYDDEDEDDNWDAFGDDYDYDDYYYEEEEEEIFRMQEERKRRRDQEFCPFIVLDPQTNPCSICYGSSTNGGSSTPASTSSTLASTSSSLSYNTITTSDIIDGNENENENDDRNDDDLSSSLPPHFLTSDQTSPTPCENRIMQHCRRHYENDVLACSEFLDLLITDGKCKYNVLSDVAREGITRGITQGRNGKGIIYVFAAGNAYNKGDITTIKGYTNTRFTITVGAVGKDGIHASYSTPGPSVFVTAPGGDVEDARNHVAPLATGSSDCGYAGIGTSFACPVVSGVVALMLEANPNLTWRDVQGILAKTSQSVYDPRDTTAMTNGAGYWHSNLYGFGIVHAGNAVRAAETWRLYSPEQLSIIESGRVDLILPDDPTVTTESVIVIPNSDNLIVESVAVYLDVQHLSRGDMEITLTSPHGTVSLLHPGKRPENTQLGDDERWKLLTVRSWGEEAAGEWKLSLTDVKAGEVGGDECVDAPFFIVYTGVGVYCNYVERYELCKDGALNEDFFSTGNYEVLLTTEDSGRTFYEACCVCGGGVYRSNYQDMLRQWGIAVYGREVLSSPVDDLERTDETSSPTKSPTKHPTRAPTNSPTKHPTRAPTNSPTKHPTRAPTKSPTKHPTRAPTKNPTKHPTRAPTKTPSAIPTDLPSINPTIAYSSHPTDVPTFEPSIEPTITLSSLPTTGPSMLPSIEPTVSLSTIPTNDPTATPSLNPTIEISRFPSVFPSNYPSIETTAQPSSSPSDYYPSESAEKTVPPAPRSSKAPNAQHSRAPTNPRAPPSADEEITIGESVSLPDSEMGDLVGSYESFTSSPSTKQTPTLVPSVQQQQQQEPSSAMDGTEVSLSASPTSFDQFMESVPDYLLPQSSSGDRTTTTTKNVTATYFSLALVLSGFLLWSL